MAYIPALDTHELKPAAEALRESQLPIGPQVVRRYIRLGRIPAQQIGNRWFTTAEAIRRALVTEVHPNGIPATP